MSSEPRNLPDDIPVLKGMVVSFAEENHRYAEENHRYEMENKLLREQVLLLRSKMFGRKTEKLGPGEEEAQQVLFDESSEAVAEEEAVSEEPLVDVPAHTRRKKGRKPLPANLPRVDVIHDLADGEKVCGCGCMMERIGQEVSEQLDIIPAKMVVIRNIRYKYACKSCEGLESEGPAVKTAQMPEQIIPKSMASPGLLAHIFTTKFADAVPFYRQEKQFARLGVEMNRTSMSSWAMKVAGLCEPMMEMLHKEMLTGPLIQADETTVQVLDEPGRSSTGKSYMWLFRGGPPGKPVLLYQYHPSRSGDVAKKFLEGYRGCVQTDGYAGYDFLDEVPGVMHAGCWAHARRKFMEVIQAQGKERKAGSADVALGYIQKLYRVEKDAKELKLHDDELCAYRQQHARPVLVEFKFWLDKKAVQTPPKGLLGQAVAYTLGQWSRLVRYIDLGFVTPDNNLAENAIRPFVVGRKNWLFSGNPEGAKASAALYSLIEMAKANGLEPYRYLRHLFENLPHAYTADEYTALMPHKIEPDSLMVHF